MINEAVLVLSANKWDFVDDRTGESRRGTTVHVCHLNSNDENSNGIKPIKYTLKPENMNILDNIQLPAKGMMIADFDFVRTKILPKSFKDLEPLKL